MYAIWIKIDETLPWIELKETYQTRKEADKASKDFLRSLQIRIVDTPTKKNQMRILATIKR